MADKKVQTRSIDDILNDVEKAQSLAQNFVKSSFALGWDAYSKEVRITGIDKETGELIHTGDTAKANAAARDTIFENVLKNVYLPETSDDTWKVILKEMNRPGNVAYKKEHFNMAFGPQVGSMWESLFDNFDKPLDTFDYSGIMGEVMKSVTGKARLAIETRYVTSDELQVIVKTAEERLAADPNMEWQLTDEWKKNPVGAAQNYLLMQRTTVDPVAAALQEQGYLRGKPRAEE